MYVYSITSIEARPWWASLLCRSHDSAPTMALFPRRVNGACEILASMRLAVPFVMIHRVPFISLGGSSDRKRMIGQPFLSVSSCGGSP